MRILRLSLLSLIAVGLIFSFSFAAGNVEKGKSLFNDPKFAGGTKACNECHPGGRGLEKSGTKKEFNIGG
jgi:cytochrome c553